MSSTDPSSLTLKPKDASSWVALGSFPEGELVSYFTSTLGALSGFLKQRLSFLKTGFQGALKSLVVNGKNFPPKHPPRSRVLLSRKCELTLS